MSVFDVFRGQRAIPCAISASSMVAGSYRDSAGATHGFIRDEQGQFATFDLPGSVSIQTSWFGHAGSIFGYYGDSSDAYSYHGFVRERDGTVVTFDVPGALGTFAHSSNAPGVI